MNKNYGFFLVLSLFCSTGLSFGADIQRERYGAIVQAFSVQNGTFNEEFIPSAGDIMMVAKYKNALKLQLAQKRKILQQSYKPMLWLAASGMLLFKAVELGLSPNTVVQKTRYEKVVEKRTMRKWDLGNQFVLPLALVTAARYSFEQVMSYNNGLVMLQQDISRHDSMINALEAF